MDEDVFELDAADLSELDEIRAAIRSAPAGEAMATAERLLRDYTGEDKDLIAPSIMESAALADDLAGGEDLMI